MFTVQSTSSMAQGAKNAATDTNFSAMYDRAKNSQQSANEKTDRSSDSFNGRSSEVVNEPDRRNDDTSSSVRSADDKGSLKDLDRDKIDDKVAKATDEIINELKEQLDVTDEDIQNAMEALGFVVADLLNADNLKSIYTELSPAEDTLSLITNEDLYLGLQEITQMTSELVDGIKESLGLSDEEFDLVMKELKDMTAKESEQPLDLNLQSDITDEDQRDLAQDIQTKVPVVEVKDDRKAVSDESRPLTKEVEPNGSTEIQVDRGVKSEKHEDHSGQNDNQFSPFSQQQNDLGINQPIEDVIVEDTNYSSYADAEEIAKQIVDQIKVRVTEETTQLEMELNPASLGKVGLQIEAKNGVITAQFTAQNEAVRAAIESQLSQLQENLDKQGVRVEAVEVTIASHEFEQNLQQEGGNDSREELEKAQAVARRRRLKINLDEESEEDLEEDLTEEEAITRDMMKRNGNSVDFTA